ncbi:hypothetical protein KILIM_056_00100 [Kineosphaera limosa NBRC 100340]|uniref:Polysaccharide chain length determinant N-terminal domain-containing protein n=1 Tax=Kineosphaera limosa NBRC 100340 TaxID=1184609 RepID=K6WTA8_9MICO|nr:hypothetical protein [Kineosphaera limosa]GAB97086.1 hypothetical protein KILIM_056_00100 [Kineosphaera limosa NBRC 100340]
MANVAENNADPWGRSLIETLRRWWWVAMAAAVIGAGVGLAAGVNSPRTAEAMLAVQIASDNPDALTRAATNAVTEANTQEVYAAAAQERHTDAPSLRSRSEILVVPNSTVLGVRVTADTAENASADANALAVAAVNQSARRMQNDLRSLTTNTETLMTTEPLADAQAERTRKNQLGGALAQSQQALLTQSRQLTVLQQADPAGATSTSPILLGLLGAIGGGLLGLALTMLFGGRRGRISSMREMRRLYPNLEFIPARDVPAIMSMEAGSSDRIVLSGVRVPAASVRGLVEPVEAGVHAAGRDTHVTEDVAQFGSEHYGRDGDRQVTVLQTPLSGAIVKRVGRDPRSVLLVLVRPHKTRFEWIDEHAAQFGERTYVVVDG